jgi:hypothetical protein
MSALGEAWAALRKVVLIETNMARLEKDVEALAGEIRRTRDYATEIDKRVVRIETMIEMSGGGSTKPRIGKI